MRLMVIADVHANLQALQAVMRAGHLLRPDRVLCLGDSVAYNANPNECVELLRGYCHVAVAGNHDRDVTGNEPVVGTSSAALQSQRWTREVLTADHLQWLEQLPNKSIEPGEYIAAHGCYLNQHHVNGYVTQTMLESNLRAIATTPAWPKLAFCAHTHVPMAAVLHANGSVEQKRLTELVSWTADAAAVLINPGSVGQPRDGDPRASFALVDTRLRTVLLQRVVYDVQAAIAAFEGTGLPAAHAERLLVGK